MFNKFRNVVVSSAMFLVIAAVANAGVIGALDVDSVVATTTSGADITAVTEVGVISIPGVRAGLLTIDTSNETGAGLDVPGYGFCIDVPQAVTIGTYAVVDLEDAPAPWNSMGSEKAALISELWGKYFDATWIAGDNELTAEAFGVAIWEIVYETDETLDITSGTGFSSTGVEEAGLANTWLNSLDGTGPMADVIALSSTNGQDFATVIPEPATMALLALGGMGIFRRKR